MPKHIRRLLLLIAAFAVLAVATRFILVDKSFYQFGHYRGAAVAEIAHDKPKYQGTEFCRSCHAAPYAAWSTGVHNRPLIGKTVKCEVCHGAGGGRDAEQDYVNATTGPIHPANLKLTVPRDTRAVCTLCHERIVGRPVQQAQVIPRDHAADEQCTLCHNPHSPRTFVGATLALSAALAAACFVKVFGVSFLGRPRSPQAANAHEVERSSVVAMGVLAALCFLAGILPGLFIDALAPVTQALVNDSMPHQSSIAWLSIVPIAESRSSYNGLLVFAFILSSGMLAAYAIHRLASDKWRKGPAWDCGFPNADPVTQYTASSFAQPIRRVFGSVVFQAREIGEMPLPGSMAPAHLTVRLRDPIWDACYAPVAGIVSFLSERLNVLQFLTIRRYLSLVFALLVLLLLALAAWP